MSTQSSALTGPHTSAARGRPSGGRRRVAAVGLVVGLSLAVVASVSTAGRRFYTDDPISREPESRDASGAGVEDIGLFYELTYNLFVTSRYLPSNTRARWTSPTCSTGVPASDCPQWTASGHCPPPKRSS